MSSKEAAAAKQAAPKAVEGVVVREVVVTEEDEETPEEIPGIKESEWIGNWFWRRTTVISREKHMS